MQCAKRKLQKCRAYNVKPKIHIHYYIANCRALYRLHHMRNAYIQFVKCFTVEKSYVYGMWWFSSFSQKSSGFDDLALGISLSCNASILSICYCWIRVQWNGYVHEIFEFIYSKNIHIQRRIIFLWKYTHMQKTKRSQVFF